eukprot:5914699-Prymnesium_polylepis.1
MPADSAPPQGKGTRRLYPLLPPPTQRVGSSQRTSRGRHRQLPVPNSGRQHRVIDMTPAALHSQRHPRAAKEGTLQKLAAHNPVSLHRVAPVLVQVAPTGPTGELT